jgi:hypothetical protein
MAGANSAVASQLDETDSVSSSSDLQEVDTFVLASESLAEDAGISLEAAKLMLADQDVLTTHANASGNEGLFGIDADVWLSRDSESQWVNVRTLNPAVIEGLHSLPFSSFTSILWVEEPPLSVQLDDPAADNFAAVVEDIIPNFQGMSVSIEDATIRIHVTDLLLRFDQKAIRDISGFDKIEIVPTGELTTTVAIRGGSALTTCTAGFPARRNNQIGFITAAHCTGTQNLYAGPSRSPLVASIPSTVSGTTSTRTNADIAFRAAPQGTITNTFFGLSTTNAVAMGGPVNVFTGSRVCSRGQSAGWRCGDVLTTAFRPSSNICNNQTCNAVFVEVAAITIGGDSGGPWITGSNNPVGIQTGGSGGSQIGNTFNRAFFSQLQFMPSGVTLG